MQRAKRVSKAKSSANRAVKEAWEAEAARRIEEVAEEQAPRHQRIAVVAASGIVLRDALAIPDTRRGGYLRADPLTKMHGMDPRMVTKAHLRAAGRFLRDYEIGILGASGGASETREVIDGGSNSGGMSDRRWDALEEYRRACDALGRTMRTPVQWVALHRIPLGRIAVLMGMSSERVSGWIIAGLDLLLAHYEPQRETRTEAIPNAVVIDATVTDIPQNRLGRAPKRANQLASG